MLKKPYLIRAAFASVSLILLGAPAMAQTADESSAASDDVAPVDVGDKPDEMVETTVTDDSGEEVPTEWVQRDGEVDVMYSFMSAGSGDMGEEIAAQAAEQAATQAMDRIDASGSQAPLP